MVSPVEQKDLWFSWRTVSPFFRSIRDAASRIGISESYLARIEKGSHTPSARVVHQLVRLYLPAHLSDAVSKSVSESVLRTQNENIPDPVSEATRALWSLGAQQITFINFHRIVYVLNSHMFRTARIPDVHMDTLAEPGYRWLLYRLIAIAYAVDAKQTEEIVQSIKDSHKKLRATEWLARLSNLPIPSEPEPDISDQSLLTLWSKISPSQKDNAIHLLERFAETESDAWPAEKWHALKPADQLAVRWLIERLLSGYRYDVSE